MSAHHLHQFGLELETHRINRDNWQLSQTPHRRDLGSRRFNPYFQTDFAESQEELVTAIHGHQNGVIAAQAALDDLTHLLALLNKKLDKNEQFWPYSLPPKLSSETINWVDQVFERSYYDEYRLYLNQRYGILHEIMTGVHINWSPTQALADELQTTKEALLLKVAQEFLRWKWLFIYLYGSAPLSLNEDPLLPTVSSVQAVRSWRQTHFGFANLKDLAVPYDTIDNHMKVLKGRVDHGELYSESEFYGTVRFKNLDDPQKMHLEFRFLDLNPLATASAFVDVETLVFFSLLVDKFAKADHVVPISLNELGNVDTTREFFAMQDPNQELSGTYRAAAENLIDELLVDYPDYQDTLNRIKQKFANSDLTTGGQIAKESQQFPDFSSFLQQKSDQNSAKLAEFSWQASDNAEVNRLYQQALYAGIEVVVDNIAKKVKLSYQGQHLAIDFETINQIEDVRQLFANYHYTDEVSGL